MPRPIVRDDLRSLVIVDVDLVAEVVQVAGVLVDGEETPGGFDRAAVCPFFFLNDSRRDPTDLGQVEFSGFIEHGNDQDDMFSVFRSGDHHLVTRV